LRVKEKIIKQRALYEINICLTIRLIEPLLNNLQLPPDCMFSKLKMIDDNIKIYKEYKRITLALQINNITACFCYINTNNITPDTIGWLIRTIADIDVTNDIVNGKMYEYFVNRNKVTVLDLRQYFTTCKIMKYCIDLVKPTIHDTILDPMCGSCDFLYNCAIYLNQNNPNINWKQVKKKFKGYDIDIDVYSNGLGTMLLATGELFIDYYVEACEFITTNVCIEKKDILKSSIIQKYDIIVSNGDKISTKLENDIPNIKYNICQEENDNICQEENDNICHENDNICQQELLFLQHIMNNLKENGRACVVLPEDFFGNISDKSFIKMRKKLIKEFRDRDMVF
jgi:type I restriction enzyme M protein